MSINQRLEEVLLSISAQMSADEIEKRSRVQHRGRFSTAATDKPININKAEYEDALISSAQMSLFDLAT